MYRYSDDSDPYNLQRFLNAQEATYEAAKAEIAAGQKRSHWMWFIFPQIQGLGSSSMARRFAISSAEEAIAYLDHAVLGARLRDCTSLVNGVQHWSVSEIFGYPDDLKFYSSVTLFEHVAQHSRHDHRVFAEALDRYFGGKPDEATLERLISGA